MRGSTPIDVEPRQGAWSDVERGAGPLALGAMHAALFALMRGDRSRSRTSVSNSLASSASTICPCSARSGCFSKAGRPPKPARPSPPGACDTAGPGRRMGRRRFWFPASPPTY